MGRGALNGSILFILTIQKLLNIEQIYKTSQQNHRYIYIYIYIKGNCSKFLVLLESS